MQHFLKVKALFSSSLVAEPEYPGRYRLWIVAWILAGPGVWLVIGLFVWKVFRH